MQVLSRTAVLILSVILTILIAASQILYCLHSTLMSPQHISRLFENDKKLAELTNTLYIGLEVSNGSENQDSFLRQYMSKILTNTDQTWVTSQVYITFKGLHQYLFSGTSTLPTIDIIPLKKAIINTLVSDIMKSDQARQRTEKIQAILSTLNNKYFAKLIALGLDNQLSSMLLELTPIRSTGLDKTAIHEIISIYLSLSNKNITLEQASTSISEQMTADALRLNEIKDYFDLSLFMDKAFGELDPLKICKTFISAANKTVTRVVNISLWYIILLLAIHERFRLKSMAKNIALCFFIAAIVMLLTSAFLVNRTFIESLLSHMYSPQGPLSYITIKCSSLLIRDFGVYLALLAIITGLFCMVLLFLIGRRKSQDKKEKGMRFFPAIRFSIGISAFLLVFMIISFISISNEYNAFKNDLARLSQINISQSVKKGLIEAGGMEFLKFIEKSK